MMPPSRPLPEPPPCASPGAPPPLDGAASATPAGSGAETLDGGVVPDRTAARLLALPRIVDENDRSADFVALARVAVGGMGTIERALQCSVGRDVALKRLRVDRGALPLAALIQEAQVLGRLDHPSVPPVFALGRDAANRPVLAMKLIEGATWRALLHDPAHPLWRALEGPRLEFHLRVLARVADAVEHAHQRGWLHRDIKPSNVMITARGDVYLIDWGLALRLPVDPAGVDAAEAVGTPRYMAPEMMRGTGPWLSPRTDVYLLGAALHEVLTGEAPHPGRSLHAALFSAWLSARHEYANSVPPALAALANDATCQDPAARPPTAEAFKQRLEAYLRDAPARTARRRAARAPRAAALALALGLALAAGLALTRLWSWSVGALAAWSR